MKNKLLLSFLFSGFITFLTFAQQADNEQVATAMQTGNFTSIKVK